MNHGKAGESEKKLSPVSEESQTKTGLKEEGLSESGSVQDKDSAETRQKEETES